MTSEDARTCLCGCGEPVGDGRRYAATGGHDSTHLKRVYADIRARSMTLEEGIAELVPGTPLADELEEYVLGWEARTGRNG